MKAVRIPTPGYTTEQHARDCGEWLDQNVRKRYREGQKEHGGKLWEKPVLRELFEEHIDEGIYLNTLIMKLQKHWVELEELAEIAETADDEDAPEALAHIADRLNDLIEEMSDL